MVRVMGRDLTDLGDGLDLPDLGDWHVVTSRAVRLVHGLKYKDIHKR